MNRHVATLVFATLAALPAAAQAPGQPPDLARLADEIAVARVADAIDDAVDRKDWAQARALFAPQVRADFTSLVGGQPATIAADDLVAGWAGNLKGSKTSLHLRTNHRVTLQGERATLHSHGYAWNRMEGQGDPLWEVWGTYVHTLVRTPQGWKVDGFTFVKTHERGNMWVKTTPGQ